MNERQKLLKSATSMLGALQKGQHSTQEEKRIELMVEKRFNEYLAKMGTVGTPVTLQKGFTYDIEEGDEVPAEYQDASDYMKDMVRTSVLKSRGKDDEKWLREDLQLFNDKALTVAHAVRRPIHTLKMWQEFNAKMGKSASFAKAIDNATSGKGLEWIPTEFSSMFIDRMEGQYQVFNLFDRVTIPMGLGTLKVPAMGGVAQLYKISGSTDDDVAKILATQPGTRNISLTPVKLGARVELEVDAIEDAAVALVDIIQTELITAATRTLDEVVLSGDISTTHQDTDVTNDADARKSWDGLRRIATIIDASKTVKFDLSNAAIAIADIKQAVQAMASGINLYNNVEDLVMIVNQFGYWQLIVLTQVLTRDLFGDAATITNGRLTGIFGIPIIQSQKIRSDLNATGTYDGTTVDRTEFIFVNKRAYLVGDKRAVTIKSEEVLATDRMRSVITLRKDFKHKFQDDQPTVTIQYNGTTT